MEVDTDDDVVEVGCRIVVADDHIVVLEVETVVELVGLVGNFVVDNKVVDTTSAQILVFEADDKDSSACFGGEDFDVAA